MRIRNATSAALIALAVAGFSSVASAQGLSRAEVRQQLVEAEANANGSRLVNNASWPDASRANQHQSDGYGPAMSGSSEAGGGSTATSHSTAPSGCKGPASFCTMYSGG